MKFSPSTIVKLNDVRAFLVFFLLTAIWTGFAGKEAGWDVLNHHIYLPYAWLNSRIHSDFFAVGPQSYQNPLGYGPFYLLAAARLPAWIIGLLLAALHACNGWVCWRLAKRLWGKCEDVASWIWMAALLAWITPVFLQTAGTSSADPVGAILVLMALYCLLPTTPGERVEDWPIFIAGIYLGFAFSIKQSNAVYIIASGIVIFLNVAANRASKISIIKHALGGGIGLTFGMGWYSWVLWEKFGNPIFPLFNNIFHSPYAVQNAGLSDRFIPGDLFEWIIRPWRMLEVKAYIYTEMFAPDVRIFLLMVFLGFISIIWMLWRTGFGKKEFKWIVAWSGSDKLACAFFAGAYLLWLLTSGNGRYAIALLMLSGIILARIIYIIFPNAFGRIILAIIIALQFMMFLYSAQFRYEPEPWDGREYLTFQVPTRLRDEPFLNVVVGVQTYGAVIPSLSKLGVSTNPVGQFALGGDPATRQVLDTLFLQWSGRVRVLLDATPKLVNDVSVEDKMVYESLLSRLDLNVNWNDCEKIPYLVAKSGGGIFGNYPWNSQGEMPDRYVISCGADRVVGDKRSVNPDFDRVARVYKIIEEKCPDIYGRSGGIPEFLGKGRWIKRYPAKDALIRVSDTSVNIQYSRGFDVIQLGSPDNILKNGVALDCKSQYFDVVSLK